MALEESTMEREIMQIVKNHFEGQLRGKKSVALESRFVEDLEADSLDTVDLIMKVEDKYNLKIGDDEISNLTTVGKLIDYVRERYVPSN